MADVDITSLSVEISAESSGAELNIDKLAAAISNLRTKGNVTKVVNSLDKLSASISALKQASTGLSGLDKITNFMNSLGNTNLSGSAKSINSVVNAIGKIPAAVSGLNGVDFYSMSGSITELTNALAPLSILDTSGLKAIGSAVNAIGKIPDLSEKLKTADLDAFSASCQKISAALTPLASQLDKVGNAFAKLPPQLSKVVTQTNRVVAANQKAGKSYLSLSSQMSSFIKRAAQLVSLKAIATYIGNAVVKFNDYYEAANLFGVSMKNLTSESSDFISKMETLLGIDPTEAMNNMATIQSLTTSFGMASDKAYVLSKNLTQLGYDLASLKNIPVAQSFTKIQAAISGELEPIRRLGVDLSQARLQQELLALGFTQSVSSLSQADKAVLRYIAIMKQTTDAQGDFARTISSPANQIRVLQAQLESLARSVGSILYPALSSILPPLIAAVELVKELVQWIAKLMNVKVEFPDFSGAASNVGDVSDALDDTTDSTKKAAKALKDYTMGFDELNIIDPTQGSSGSGSGSGATGNILGDVDLSGYDMFKEYVGSAVDEIKEKIKSMLPIIEAVAGAFALWELGKFIGQIGEVLAGMNGIQKAALLIATLVVEWTLVQKFSDEFLKTGDTTKLFYTWLTTIAAAIGGYATFGAEGATLAFIVSAVVQFESIKTNLASGVADATDGAVWMQAISSALTTGIAGAIFTKSATGFVLSLSVGAVIALTSIAYGGTKGGSVKPGDSIDTLLTALTAAAGGIAGVTLALAAGAAAPIAGAALVLGVGVGVVLEQLGITFGEKDRIKDVEKYIKDYEDKGYTTLAIHYRLQNLGFSDDEINMAEQGIDSTFEVLRYTFDQKMTAINDWWNEKWEGFKTNFSKSWDDLTESLGNVGQALQEKVKAIQQSAADAGKAAADWVNNILKSFTDKRDAFFDAGKNLIQGFIDGLKKLKSDAVNAVTGIADSVVDKFKNLLGIHSPSTVFREFGGYITQGLANGIIGGLGYVENATNRLIDATAQAGKDFVNKGIDYGTGFVSNIITGLDNNWEQLNSSLQNDFFGTVQTFIQQAQSGDWKSVGTTIAATIWGAMGEEQRNQIKTVAADLISQLSKTLSNAASSLFDTAAKLGKSIVSGISNNFGEAVSKAQSMISSITDTFKDAQSPLSSAALAISQGLKGGLLSQFPKMLTGVAGLITTIGGAFTAMLQTIGSTLSVFGIPTGWAMVAGGIAIAASIAGIVASIGSSSRSSSVGSSDYTDKSNYVGSSSYNSGSSYSSYTGGSYSSTGNSEDTRDAVYNGCYNAFLDIMQRYGEQLLQGQEVKVYLDGRQLTASVEKTQKDRGIAVMGTEVYSY